MWLFWLHCRLKTYDKVDTPPPHMGGNIISPVPGICATNNSKDIKAFEAYGCNEDNTIALDPSERNWGGMNHIDEKVSIVPNPNSRKKHLVTFL